MNSAELQLAITNESGVTQVEKMAAFNAWIKKNGFWLSCGLLSVAMIGTWFLITQQVDSQTATYAQNVKTQIQAAESIMRVVAEEGVAAHPNASSEAGMQIEIKKTLDEIIAAWKLREAAQKSILKWPTEIIGNEEFVTVFSLFNPLEKFPERYEGGAALGKYLNLYRNTIPKQMEYLCKDILRAKWNYASSDATTGSDDLARYAVVWDDQNQELWHQKLTRFRGRDDHFRSADAPTPLQVYVLQQDLWLLEAMFKIIRSVNGDVTANDLAAIKRIDHVVLGREARTQLGSLTPADRSLAGSFTETSAVEIPSGRELPDDGSGNTEGFDLMASYSPYHGRYVGVDFQPLTAEEVRTVLTGDTLPTENLELIVAKRVPVRIALRMDERQIPEFMTACANSPFAFEINQVRLNRHVPGEGIVLNGGGYGAGNSGGPTGGSRERRGSLGMGQDMKGGRVNTGGMAVNSGGQTAATSVETRTNYDINVEFYGIVKIYNPVRESYLRKAAGELGSQPDPNDAASNILITGERFSIASIERQK